MDDLRLGRLLVQRGHITEEALDAALAEQDRLTKTGSPVPRLGEMLVARGNVTAEVLQDTLAHQARTTLRCPGCRGRFSTSKPLPPRPRCPKCGQELVRDDPSTMPTAQRPVVGTVSGPTLLKRPEVSPADLKGPPGEPIRRLGKLMLLEELGRGGMGIVYRAWQDDLQRVVAAKVAHATADRDTAARFLREARIASKLRHPNIVPVHELGEHEGQPWFTMDYIEGKSLAAHLEEGLSQGEVLEIVRTLARALHHAHEQGIIHRDVKPQNVVLGAGGTPHLTDFGLARHILSRTNITHAEAVLGTPRYMSPEQARGQNNLVGAQSDIYSLGAVLYEGLAGVPAVEASDLRTMIDAIATKVPPRPSDRTKGVSADLDAITMKCLEKDPGRRYATALDLAEDLDRVLAGEPIDARPRGTLERVVGGLRRRRPAVAAVFVTAAIIAIGVQAWRHRIEFERYRLEVERERGPAPSVPTPPKMSPPAAGVAPPKPAEPVALATDPATLAKLLDALREEAIGRCGRHEFAKAREAIRAKGAELDAAHGPRLAELSDAIDDAEAFWRAVAGGARAAGNVAVRVRAVAGTVIGGTDAHAVVRLEGQEAPVEVPYDDLASDELVRLAEAGGARPEAIGVFRLARGDGDGARRAWASSPRKAPLDAIAAVVAPGSSARVDPAPKADPPGVPKPDPPKPTPPDPVPPARDLIGEADFAVAPERTGDLCVFRYDFQRAQQLLDWGLKPLDLEATHEPHGMRTVAGSAYLRNGGMVSAAKLNGDVRLLAQVWVNSGDVPAFGLAAGGYVWSVREAGKTRLMGPGDREVLSESAVALTRGTRYRVELVVAGGRVAGFVNGKQVFDRPQPSPPKTGEAGFFALRDTTVGIDDVVLSGTPDPKWLQGRAAQVTAFSQASTRMSGQAVRLADGRSEGKFEKFGDWDHRGDGFQGEAAGKGREGWARLVAEAPEAFRLGVRFRFDEGLYAQIVVSTGHEGSSAKFILPADPRAEWRTADILAVPGAVRCVVDGSIVLLPEKDDTWKSERRCIEIGIGDGAMSVGHTTIEEIRLPR